MPGEAIGQMLYTSATTGRAKGVMLTQANLAANYDPSAEWLGYTGADTILCALPLFNTFALNQCINATTVTGGTLVVLPRFEAVAVHASHRRATAAPCSPACRPCCRRFCPTRRWASTIWARSTKIMVGAAPVPTPLLLKARSYFGAGLAVVTGYGLTEATALVTTMTVELDADGRQVREKSIGRAVPAMDVRILGEDGAVLPPGQPGEIGIRGPNVMAGYYKQPTETAAALAGGWLRTGDVGVMDGDGYFWIVDRKKDVIIRGGQNIYPADVEEALYGHPAVAEAAVVAAVRRAVRRSPGRLRRVQAGAGGECGRTDGDLQGQARPVQAAEEHRGAAGTAQGTHRQDPAPRPARPDAGCGRSGGPCLNPLAQAAAASTREHREGLAAFAKGRAPDFIQPRSV